MKRRVERLEVVCESCGIMAEIYRPPNAPKPRLCDCPEPHAIRTSTRPRLCIHCGTKLNRYNSGSACGPCAHSREGTRSAALG